MPPVLTLGGLLISTPRLAFAIAVLAGAALTRWLARHHEAGNRRRLERMGELLIVTMLLAARAGFAVQNWSAYRTAPWTTLYLWQPGYNVWAGAAGALVFVALATISWPRRNTSQPAKLLAQGFTLPLLAFLGFHLASPLWRQEDILGQGDRVPPLAMQNLTRQPVTLGGLTGHPLIVNVWASWCLPCREEIPLLNRAYQHYANRRLAVVGVDLSEDRSIVRRFAAQQTIAYPVWTDPPGTQGNASPSRTLFRRTGGFAVPTTLFVDCKGIIRNIQIGKLNAATLHSQVSRILC